MYLLIFYVVLFEQVFSLLKELDPKFIEKFVSRRNSLFLSSIPVTPNCNRVMETMHVFADGPRLTFVSFFLIS